VPNLNNTVFLKGAIGRRAEEARSVGATKPGHLLEKVSIGKVQPHSTRGGLNSRMFAREDSYQFRGVDDAYAADEIVFYNEAAPGEQIYARLKLGENIAIGDTLISYGDGTLAKAASGYLANTAAASTAITNTNTETAFSNGTVTIPANTLKVGDVIRVRAQGIATATNSTDTLTVKLKIGSDVVAATAALDVADNDIFVIDASIVIRTIGATGTFVATGFQIIGPPATATAKPFSKASTTIDTTAAQTLSITATWSVASTSNSVRMDVFLVEEVSAQTTNSSGSGGGSPVGRAEEANNLSAEEEDDWIKITVL
jgi:hypothetical protein